MKHIATKHIQVHIHSFSLRYQFRYRDDFDVFKFIKLAKESGFTGVNISANGPGYRDLGGTSSKHFNKVRQALKEQSMNCELDTSDTRKENLSRMLDVANAIGAEQLRVYTRYQGSLDELINWTVQDFKTIAPKAESLGINIVLENHEDFQGDAIAEILQQVDHPRIRALYDYGNSQMVGEDPIHALEAMIDYVTAVHVKDHIVVEHEGQDIIQGVAIGDGLLPVMQQTERLYDAGLRRFCFENVWGYVAPIIEDIKLPNSAIFAKHATHHYLCSDTLPRVEALDGELTAFERGWKWFCAELARAGYSIQA